jgi:hypothetical protein
MSLLNLIALLCESQYPALYLMHLKHTRKLDMDLDQQLIEAWIAVIFHLRQSCMGL